MFRLKFIGKIKEKYWMIILFSIFIFSFVLDLLVLTRYPLSYRIDGPFYNLQIQNILTTGFPASGDPPIAYYILTPFVMLTENSFLGLKIGISLIGSLMAFLHFSLQNVLLNS